MGKDRNKKFKACKPRPTGLPSVKEFEAELVTSQIVSDLTIQNLVEKVCLLLLVTLSSGAINR